MTYATKLTQADTDVTSLFDGHLSDLRRQYELLEKHAEQHKAELGVFVSARWIDALTRLDDAIRALSCDLCDKAVMVARESGDYCLTCADRWRECKACKCDVLHSEAIEDEGQFYHGPCYPSFGSDYGSGQ